MPARAVSTRVPNQPPSALSTLERSLTRSAMLNGTSSREHGLGRPSLQGSGVTPARVLKKSIRVSSWVLLVCDGAATTNPPAAISSSVGA